MAVTPNQARAELARRELQRRGVSLNVPQTPSAFQQVRPALQQFDTSQIGSPQQMLGMIPPMLSKIAGQAGETLATNLAQKGVNPYVSAGLGTVAAMGPDIAMTAANPISKAPNSIPEAAIPFQRRAYGFQKSLLKTPFARGKAAMAARTGLEQGVSSATGNPDVMMNKATALAGKAGQKLGDIRSQAGKQPIDPFISALDDYKEARLRGATGGKWDAIANKIEEAKKTINGLVERGKIEPQPEKIQGTGILDQSGKEITRTVPAVAGYTPPTDLNRIAEAKKEIRNIVNWFAENVGQDEAKKLTGVIEKATEQAISNSGGDIKKYRALKPIYGAMKTIQKGLNNEIAGQQGNMAVSLPSQVMGGAGAAATGDIKGMLKAIGISEGIKRRGAGITASELVGAANAPKNLGPNLVQALLALRRKRNANSSPQ